MAFKDRLMAAFNVFTGKVPPPKAVQDPFFYNFSAAMLGTPVTNNRLSAQQLRTFSESPIVRRAIDYIRAQVARLDWDIEPKTGKKLTAAQRKEVEKAKAVLASPNPDDSWMSLIGQMIEDMLVIGWGISEVKEYNGDQPYLLYPVDASSIQVYLDWDGDPQKRRYAQFDLQGNQVDFKPYELMVFKHNPRSSTPFGLSPTEVAVQQIQYLLDAQSYAGKTASNAVPKKLLFMGRELTEKQLQEFRMYFRSEIEGRSHIPIVGGTDDVKSIELGLVGDQALFLEWQKFLIAIVADAFGLDVMKFNVTVGINRSTGDVLDDVSDESAIIPMAMQIQQVINQRFLSYFGLSDVAEFKFHFTASYQDRKSLAVIHQIYGQLDALTINEIRAEIGKPPLEVDEKLGKSKGDYTLSEYRGIYGATVTLQDAVGIDSDTGTVNPLQEEAQAKVAQAGGAKDPNNNGGNNGVYGAPTPKDKPMNQRSDKGARVTL